MKKRTILTKALPAASFLTVLSFITYEFSNTNTLFINTAFVLLLGTIGIGLTMIASTEAENLAHDTDSNDQGMAHQSLVP